MLDNLDAMLTIPGTKKELMPFLLLCHAALSSFREIVTKIFSTTLATNWEALIEDFCPKYLALGISVTTKV
jgi:hypothetical protein